MSRPRKATLSDVASHAGVSRTTASYIINGLSSQMRISTDTERRVREAVSSLGYRPNHSARSLRTAKTSTIGVITDFVASGMFASAMIAGANSAARRADHLLVIGESEGDEEVRDRLIDEMIDRQVDGLVYVTRTAMEIELPEKLRDVRTVLLNCVDPSSPNASVLPDELVGGATAAQALLASGLTEDVFVVGEDSNPAAIASALRLRGIRQGFQDAGAEVTGVIACEWSVEAARDAVSDWLDHGHPVRAFVCLNDRVGMGVYQALAAHQLTVGDDVSVVSFDGSDLATWLNPALTSVSLPFRAMGELAAKLVLDPASGPETHLLPMPLKVGSSIRPEGTTPRA